MKKSITRLGIGLACGLGVLLSSSCQTSTQKDDDNGTVSEAPLPGRSTGKRDVKRNKAIGYEETNDGMDRPLRDKDRQATHFSAAEARSSIQIAGTVTPVQPATGTIPAPTLEPKLAAVPAPPAPPAAPVPTSRIEPSVSGVTRSERFYVVPEISEPATAPARPTVVSKPAPVTKSPAPAKTVRSSKATGASGNLTLRSLDPGVDASLKAKKKSELELKQAQEEAVRLIRTKEVLRRQEMEHQSMLYEKQAEALLERKDYAAGRKNLESAIERLPQREENRLKQIDLKRAIARSYVQQAQDIYDEREKRVFIQESRLLLKKAKQIYKELETEAEVEAKLRKEQAEKAQKTTAKIPAESTPSAAPEKGSANQAASRNQPPGAEKPAADLETVGSATEESAKSEEMTAENLDGELESIEVLEAKLSRLAETETGLTEWLSPDEVWVIYKGDTSEGADEANRPRAELLAQIPGAQKLVPMPLTHTQVKANISGYVAKVGVQQQYENPFSDKIEATYVFPLPEDAAVTDFIMTVGDRRIRGIIREKEEAQAIYESARRQGHVASLLTQERPNIFQQKVANIEPGKRIDIDIMYFNTLKYVDGEYEFAFPMVVGPRYNPGDSPDGIGAQPRGASKGPQNTSVQYLAPDERSGHDIQVTVNIEAGLEIHDLRSTSHAVHIDQDGSRASITLRPQDQIPNKDLVLRYRLAGAQLGTAMLTEPGEGDITTFALLIEPPEDVENIPKVPREMIFVLDCSGSMNGFPMEKSKQAMRECISQLRDEDTFNVIRFSSRASALGNTPIPATRENRNRGMDFVTQLSGSGGTRMIEGIRAALDMPGTGKRQRIVSFMTDGYIGNEGQILQAIRDKLGDAHVFSFGIGNSVNRYLIQEMGREGKGAAAYIGLSQSADRVVHQFYKRVAHPALSGAKIDWNGMKVFNVYPQRLPDLYVGRPVLVVGKCKGPIPDEIVLRGESGGQAFERRISTRAQGIERQHEGINFVWARRQLDAMSYTELVKPSLDLKKEMTEFSIDHRVLCGYTAFLAVDSSHKTPGGAPREQPVAVPVPDGVSYDETVGP